MLEIEATGRRGRMATRSGQNVVEAEKITSSVSRRPTEIQVSGAKRDSITGLSFAASSVSPNHRKVPKWPSSGVYRLL